MADRNSSINKKVPQNHKKKKNKASKRKASSNNKNKSKLNSTKNNNKFSSSVHPIGNFSADKHDNSLTERNSFYSPKRDYHDSNERTGRISSSQRDKHQLDRISVDSCRLTPQELEEEHVYYNRNRSGDRRVLYNKTSVFDDESYERTPQTPENTEFLLQRVAFLANQVDALTQENLRLNQTLFDIKYNWSVISESDVEIVIKKPELSKKFAYVLQNLVNKLLDGQVNIEDVDKLINSSTEHVETRDSPEPDCLFAVDSSADPQLNENTPVPKYEASFHEILESPNDSKTASSTKDAGISPYPKNCFNCGEDHHLTKCPYKLDYRKIAIARKRQRKTNFLSNTRYHVHGKNENDFKPGIISDELRDALSLQINQIPPYVYRMRVLDYPPGWLCEAAVESSGITLYGSDGNVEEEENCEDGLVDTTGVRVQYDPDKLVDYPGFNVPLPPDIIDESFELGLPPLQTHQLRCLIERNMVKPNTKPSRKRKLTLKDNRPTKFQRCEEDMEIDDSDGGTIDSNEFVSEFVPPLPESAPPPLPPPPPPPPPPPGEDSEISEDVVLSKFAFDSAEESSLSAVDHLRIKSCPDFSSGTSSPSLAELEELKKKLVLELGIGMDEAPSSSASVDEDSSLNPDLTEDKNSDENYILEDEFIASEDSNELSNVSETSSVPNKTSEPECSEPMQRTISKSKFMTLGTPSLSRHSSFSRLPDYEKFSENVSSHIPFENLPNSTGTYSRMKNVLKKVKEKLNSLIQ